MNATWARCYHAIWVPMFQFAMPGPMPGSGKAATRNDINSVASLSDLMKATPADASPEIAVPVDTATEKGFDKCFAEAAARFVR